MRKQFKDLATRGGAMAMAAAMAFSPCMDVMASSVINNDYKINADNNINNTTLNLNNMGLELESTTHDLSAAMTEMLNYLENNEVSSTEDHEYGNVNIGDKITVTAEHYEKIVNGDIVVKIKTLPTDPYNSENSLGCDIIPADLGFEKDDETGNYVMTLGDMFKDKESGNYKIFSTDSWKLFARYIPNEASGIMLLSVTEPVENDGTLVFYLEATEEQEKTHKIDFSVEPEWEINAEGLKAKATFKCIHGDDCDKSLTLDSEVDTDLLSIVEGEHEGTCVAIGKHYYTAKFEDKTSADGPFLHSKEFYIEELEADDHLFDATAEGGLGFDSKNHFEICLRDGCDIGNIGSEAKHNLGWDKNETHHWQICEICDYSTHGSNHESYGEHYTSAWTESKKPGYGVKGEESGTCDSCGIPMTRETDALVDDKAPSVEIKFGDITSKDFTSTITNIKHTNKDITITVKAEDAETEIKEVGYVVSPTILTETDLASATFNKLETGKNITINKDGEYYVYVKAVDKEGNTKIAWLESAIIRDTVSPEITGYKEGEEYCASPTITVKEDNLDKVTVGDKEAQLDSNKSYKVVETGNIVITVTDKAGNKTTAKFKNNGKHTEVEDKKVPATCMESGLTAGSHCKVCDKILEKQEVIPAGEHSFKNGQLDRKSTSNLEGRIKYDCIHCDWYYYETIPVDGKTDDGEIDKGMYVYKDAPAAQLISSKDALMDMDIFEEDELDDIEDKKAYGHVFFKVEELKEKDIPDRRVDALEALAEKLGAKDSGLYYFDMTLYKQIDDQDPEKISDPGKDVKIRLTIPESIAKDNREIIIMRYTDGEALKLEGKYNTKTHDFTFEVNEDAIYAITYKEGSKNSDTETNNNGTTSNSGNNSSEDNTVNKDKEYDSAPDMGDTRTVGVTPFTMLLSGIVGLVSSKKRRMI